MPWHSLPIYLEIVLGGGVACADAMMMYRGGFP